MSDSKPRAALGLLVFVARLFLGGVFVFAAWLKLSDPQAFAGSVRAFELIPAQADHLRHLITFVVPWTELLTGLLLLVGFWTRAAATMLAILLTVFIAGLASVLARGMIISCSCFGNFEIPCVSPVSSCHVIRNSVLLTVALFILWKAPGSLAIDKTSRDPS